MKVICEKYNHKDKDCKRCYHATIHNLLLEECMSVDFEKCGICSIKPLRKEKLKKLKQLYENIHI